MVKQQVLVLISALILSTILPAAIWTGNDAVDPTDWNRNTNWDTGVPGVGETAWFSTPNRPSPVLTGFANPLNLVVGSGVDIGTCRPVVAVGGELKLGTVPNILWVGYYGGKGTMTLDGGTIWNVSSLILADGTAATEGTFEVKSGTFTLTEGPRIGWSGKGTLDISGGTLNCAFVQMGVIGGSEGTLVVSGGTMNITASLIAGVAANTISTVNMSGGTITVDGVGSYVELGSAAGTTVVFNMSGGTLNYNGTARFAVGFSGNGTLNVSGNALVNIPSGRLRLSQNAGSTGTVNLSGGQIRANIIDFDNTTGLMNISGTGKLVLNGDQRKKIMDAISNGLVVAYNGYGCLLMDYNKTEAGKTVVRGVMPEAGRSIPYDFYVHPLNTSTASVNEMMASLAGLVNRYYPEVVLGGNRWDTPNRPEYWLTELIQETPIRLQLRSDPAWFINRYKTPYIAGYVRYDAASLNRAASLAGVLNAIIVDDSTLSYATAAGLTQLADARTMTDVGVYNSYASQFSKDYYVNIDVNHSFRLKDFVVSNKAFISYEPSNWSTIYSALNKHANVIGFGPSEQTFFRRVSDNNLTAVVGEDIQGISAFSRWNVPRKRQRTHTVPWKTTEPDVHYVAFVMSDGDNLAHILTRFLNNQDYFASPYRGTFTMNWDLVAKIADLHPLAMNYLYDQASKGTHKDFFVAAGGEGICFPSRYPDKAGYAARTAEAMAKADHNVISILDESFNTTVMNNLTAKREVLGIMYKTFSDAYKGRNGQIDWFNGKPVVSVRYSLWSGVDSKEAIRTALNSRPRSPLTNQGSYTIVNVHPWSPTPMENVKWIVDNLDPKVRVVTLEELMIHLRNNFGTPVPYPTLAKIAEWWLAANCAAGNGWCAESDLDGDGKVTMADFAIYAERWHSL